MTDENETDDDDDGTPCVMRGQSVEGTAGL